LPAAAITARSERERYRNDNYQAAHEADSISRGRTASPVNVPYRQPGRYKRAVVALIEQRLWRIVVPAGS
jgi:hypothetical protein